MTATTAARIAALESRLEELGDSRDVKRTCKTIRDEIEAMRFLDTIGLTSGIGVLTLAFPSLGAQQ